MQIIAFLPMRLSPSPKPHRGGGLAFTRRRRVDRGDQDQLAVFLVFLAGDEIGETLALS